MMLNFKKCKHNVGIPDRKSKFFFTLNFLNRSRILSGQKMTCYSRCYENILLRKHVSCQQRCSNEFCKCLSILSSPDAVVKEEHIKSFGLNPFFSLPSTLITHKYKSEPFEALFMLPDFDFADFTSSKGKKNICFSKTCFFVVA